MENFRAPAYPLITVDPFFNIWSFTDKLYDDVPRHWTGQRNFLTGVVTVDGKSLRFMGSVNPDNIRYYREPDVIEQVSVEVLPLTTQYVFKNEQITLNVNFMTPLIPEDPNLMSRPISYISYEVKSNDSKPHDIGIYFDVSCELCVNTPEGTVYLDKTEFSLTASSGTDHMLERSGDDHRIEWGTLHLMAPGFDIFVLSAYAKMAKFNNEIKKTYRHTHLPKVCKPRDGWCALACEKLYEKATDISGFICIGYDDIKSIQYFGKNIEAYWRRDGATFEQVAKSALGDYEDIKARVHRFEKDLTAKAVAVSEKYAAITALAFRQSVSAHKLTWDDGEIQFFSKENYSNGCIGTVDVTYPSVPLFLIYNPTLVEGMLNPIFKLCDSGLWKYEFAPHDVGQYPLANNQVYGIGTRYVLRYMEREIKKTGKTYEQYEESYQMPIEECGNMILCVAAVCAAKKDWRYAKKHFDILDSWANYLLKCGFDPEDQLCTDDFAGHLAHNCNLSVKAIEAIAAWAQICQKLAEPQKAEHYKACAQEFAAKWEQAAKSDDHYKLAFDNDDSWSLKYNMVWDKLLNLNVFNPEIAEREVKYYLKKLNKYGVPLDVRSDYTKSDWQMWTTVLTDNRQYLDGVINAMYDMLENTRDRVPFSDWYFTSTPFMRGFQNRSVQGGLFINLLKF